MLQPKKPMLFGSRYHRRSLPTTSLAAAKNHGSLSTYSFNLRPFIAQHHVGGHVTTLRDWMIVDHPVMSRYPEMTHVVY